jgi:hypothetical protein
MTEQSLDATDFDEDAFRIWLEEVDAELRGRCGLTHDGLADQPWAHWFAAGIEPWVVVNHALDALTYED